MVALLGQWQPQSTALALKYAPLGALISNESAAVQPRSNTAGHSGADPFPAFGVHGSVWLATGERRGRKAAIAFRQVVS